MQIIRTHFAALIFLGGLCILSDYFTSGQYFIYSADESCICSGHLVNDLIPDCEDCSGYYICGDGSYEKVKCPQGLIFDLSSKKCVLGQCPRFDGTCSVNTTTPAPTTPSTTSTTTTSEPPGPCANDVTCQFQEKSIPHPYHCRNFYTCYGSCAVLGLCELGKWFDREKNLCDYSYKVINCPANQD
ncbi:probable endochitinase isoform X1 [Drosophila teissieri]|uniref:probable endochitinase isoform X1 n=1 Tax=Drosophila teissieri TaxID=7243 RepID=UPI001CBA464B|nr:probable endochitinase isoform X1 [Drosophila teissieri]